jgi:autotransporter-associated beta strand protein
MKTTNQTSSAPPGQTTMPRKIQRMRMFWGGMLAAMFHALLGPGTEAMAADVVLAQARADFSSVTPATGNTTATWGGGSGIPDTYGRTVSTNGCGHWNYFQSDNANPTSGTLALLSWQPVGNAGNSGYGGSANFAGFMLPSIGASKIFGDSADPAADQVTWHPYLGGQPYAVLRWTAGAAESGLIKIEGAIDKTGEPGGEDSFAVFVNGVSQFSVASLPGGNSYPFSFSLTVSAGQNVDFVLGGISFGANEAKLSATISVPGQNTVTYDADPGTAGAQDGAGAWDSTTANWWDGVSSDVVWPDGTAEEAIIGAGTGAAGIIAVTDTRTLNKLTFNPPGSGTYTLSGGTLSFGGTLPTITGTADATISSILAGTAGLTKTGTNTVTLNAVNTYTGSTTVSNGTLEVAAGGVINNAGPINAVTGGTLTIAGTVDVTNGVLAVGSSNAGTGTMNIQSGAVVNVVNGTQACNVYVGGKINNGGSDGVGILNISGTLHVPAAGTGVSGDASRLWLNPYGGSGSTINLNGGTLSTARPIADGTATVAYFNFNGGVLQAAANDFNILEVVGPLTVTLQTGGGTIDTNGFNVTVAPSIDGSGSLTKTNTGTLTLTGANTYTGDTTVTGGTLAVNGNSIADTNKLVIAGGIVDVAASADEVVNTLYYGTTQQPAGTYGSSSSTATYQDDTRFSGTGTLTVTTGPTTGGNAYDTWAHNHAGDGAPSDDYNNDGVSNGVAYFMDATGVATNPGVVGNTVTWRYLNAVTSFEVQVSDDLVIWENATTGVDTVLPPDGHVIYTLPTGPGITKKFCRLMVVP